MRVQRRGDWLVARAGGVIVLMSREKVHHIGITEVGVRIWELIEKPRDVEVICTDLRKEYDIAPETCRAEVDSFLNELDGHGAVTLDPENA